jgi:hypothetical protein
MEECHLVQRISDDFGDEGVLWRPRRVREFLEAALRNGWCQRLPICKSSGNKCSNLYYPDPYFAVRWLDANPDWVVPQAGGMSEALGASDEMVVECRAGTSVYAVYGGRLAIMKPGLSLPEIQERCALSLSLPTNWAAHVGSEDVYEDYRAQAGDVIKFCEDLILKETPIAIQRSSTAPATRLGAEAKDDVSEATEMVGSFLRNAKGKASESPAAYYHSASETPPEPYHNNGPIAGTKKSLASVAFVGAKFDRRSLDSWVKDGLLWGQRIHHRLYRIWFQQSSDFRAAKNVADNCHLGQEEIDSK